MIIDLHHNGTYPVQYDWDSFGDSELYLQGGTRGIVFRKDGSSYRTAFVELFVAGSFFRGEGESLEEAESAIWNKYNKSVSCGEHVWEPRGYHNGGGFCKYCNTFRSNVFTGEQLGQFCHICGVGTTYSWNSDNIFGCEHHPVREESTSVIGKMFEALNPVMEEE